MLTEKQNQTQDKLFILMQQHQIKAPDKESLETFLDQAVLILGDYQQ